MTTPGVMSPDKQIIVYAHDNGRCWLAGVCKAEATHWLIWKGKILRRIAVCEKHAVRSVLNSGVAPDNFYLEAFDTAVTEGEDWE